MKTHNLRPLSFLIFLSLLFILQGCTSEPGVWKNEKINGGVKADFHARNEELIGYIKLNQVKRVKAMLSRELSHDNSTEPLIEHLSNRFNDNKYQLLDEYYLVNKYIDADTIKASGTGINAYSLTWSQPAQEMYISMFLPKDGENKYLISIVYSKLDYGWRITGLEAAPYTFNGETCPELFNRAKAAYNKGYLIDAVNTAALAVKCIQPMPVWQYAEQDSLADFYNRILALANEKYHFPYVLTELPTKPRIFRVFNQTDERGSFPMIHYLTTISLKDTVALKKENAQIRKIIGKIMPGIDKDKKYVLYSAFNEKPVSTREVDRFEMTDRLR
ncbi:MAG: hypothetical protein ABIN13_18045 [Mucilaginibacter sp.]